MDVVDAFKKDTILYQITHTMDHKATKEISEAAAVPIHSMYSTQFSHEYVYHMWEKKFHEPLIGHD